MDCEKCEKYPVHIIEEDEEDKVAALGLNVEEWMAIKKALDLVPIGKRDPQWSYAAEGVTHLLEHVSEMRDFNKDPRHVLEPPVCMRDGCGRTIERGEDYYYEGETGNIFCGGCYFVR